MTFSFSTHILPVFLCGGGAESRGWNFCLQMPGFASLTPQLLFLKVSGTSEVGRGGHNASFVFLQLLCCVGCGWGTFVSKLITKSESPECEGVAGSQCGSKSGTLASHRRA